MSIFEIILLGVGFILLILAIFSGIALYGQSIKNTNKDENNASTGTLWMLFILGIVGGLLFVWFGLNEVPPYTEWVFLGLFFIGLVIGLMSLLG